MFLMRCLFSMFACSPGIELLPAASFRDVLARCKQDPSRFGRIVEQLWEAIDKDDFALRDWEQGAAQPDQSARAYFRAIAGDAAAVQQALAAVPPSNAA